MAAKFKFITLCWHKYTVLYLYNEVLTSPNCNVVDAKQDASGVYLIQAEQQLCIFQGSRVQTSSDQRLQYTWQSNFQYCIRKTPDTSDCPAVSHSAQA